MKRRPAPWLLGVCCVLFFRVAGLAEDRCGPAEQSQADLSWLTQKTELKSDPLLPRLRLTGDPDLAGISFVTIRPRDLSGAGGSGEIVLDRSRWNFNEFGDATSVEDPRDKTYPITLQPIGRDDPRGEGRLLFAVQFENEAFDNRMYLVLSPGPIFGDRLLVMGGENPQDLAELASEEAPLDAIIPLHTTGESSCLRSLTRVEPERFSTGEFRMSVSERRGRVQLSTMADNASLSVDENYLTYGPFGDVASSTLIGYRWYGYEIQKQSTADPAGRGRSLLELVPRDTPDDSPEWRQPWRRFQMVMSSVSDGTDRLLIRTNGILTHVLPLTDGERISFLQQIRGLESSPDELELIEQARELIGNQFQISTEEGHVRQLSLSWDGVNADSLLHFAQLPQIQRLQLSGGRPDDPSILNAIGGFRQLTSLIFYCVPLNDGVLEQIGLLEHLRYLRIYDEVPPKLEPETVPRVTDAGLEHIARLPRLARLQLSGLGITDAGLMRLKDLPELESLDLQRTAVTVSGLVAFAGQQPQIDISLSIWIRPMSAGGDDESLSCSVDMRELAAGISGSLATDELIAELCELTDLKSLSISSRIVTDAGLKSLAALEDLESLRLDNNDAVTNDGLRSFSELPSLRKLNLWYCRNIDDGAIEELSALAQLEELNLGGTQVSESGLQTLQRALPNCRIEKR